MIISLRAKTLGLIIKIDIVGVYTCIHGETILASEARRKVDMDCSMQEPGSYQWTCY